MIRRVTVTLCALAIAASLLTVVIRVSTVANLVCPLGAGGRCFEQASHVEWSLDLWLAAGVALLLVLVAAMTWFKQVGTALRLALPTVIAGVIVTGHAIHAAGGRYGDFFNYLLDS
jgi:hypothetical protein